MSSFAEWTRVPGRKGRFRCLSTKTNVSERDGEMFLELLMRKRKPEKETGTAGKMHYTRYPASGSERVRSITASFFRRLSGNERISTSFLTRPSLVGCWGGWVDGGLLGSQGKEDGDNQGRGGCSWGKRVPFFLLLEGGSRDPVPIYVALDKERSRRRQGWLGG